MYRVVGGYKRHREVRSDLVNERVIMQKGGCVYILTTPNRRSLYTGVTADLYQRVWEHREKVNLNCFTAKYNCVMLVYYKALTE